MNHTPVIATSATSTSPRFVSFSFRLHFYAICRRYRRRCDPDPAAVAAPPTIDDRDPRAQASGDPLRNKRVHVLGTGMVAAAMGSALSNTGLIEGLDFVIIDPDEIETTGESDVGPAATPRVVSISYGPKGGDLTLVTSAGTVAARNIVVANDAIWHNSGLASELPVRRVDKSERAGPAFTGRPVPGLFTVGYPGAAPPSEQLTLDAATARIAALIEQRK